MGAGFGDIQYRLTILRNTILKKGRSVERPFLHTGMLIMRDGPESRPSFLIGLKMGVDG